MTKTFEMVFNDPMNCEDCEQTVKMALQDVQGLETIKLDWKANLVNVFGYVAPSDIVASLQGIGKDAILRGTGKPNSAAVCILESLDPVTKNHLVKGLARMMAVDEGNIVVDLTLSLLENGTYYPQIRSSGNLSEGAFSTGKLFHSFGPIKLGDVRKSDKEKGLASHQQLLSASLKIHELIGRSFVLSKAEHEITADSLLGVVARSAGAWENNKSVCTCSGRTVWQERIEAFEKGITS